MYFPTLPVVHSAVDLILVALAVPLQVVISQTRTIAPMFGLSLAAVCSPSPLLLPSPSSLFDPPLSRSLFALSIDLHFASLFFLFVLSSFFFFFCLFFYFSFFFFSF